MRRTGLVCVLFAGLCVLLGLVWPGNAGADSAGKVLVSVDGAAFTAHPSGALLDTAGLSPGQSTSAILGVRSGFGVGVKLSLALIHVHNDDNGCTPAEETVDTTCGAGQGDLAGRLVMTIARATHKTGPYHALWSGTAADLEHAVTIDGAVPAKGERWLTVTATLPGTVGNVVQSDTLTFGVRAVLSGNGASGGAAIDGTHSGIDSIHTGGDQPNSHGVDALAVTGFSAVLFVIGAVALLVAGCLLTAAGRAQRRATSGSSSTRRRGPRPASARTARRARDRAR